MLRFETIMYCSVIKRAIVSTDFFYNTTYIHLNICIKSIKNLPGNKNKTKN